MLAAMLRHSTSHRIHQTAALLSPVPTVACCAMPSAAAAAASAAYQRPYRTRGPQQIRAARPRTVRCSAGDFSGGGGSSGGGPSGRRQTGEQPEPRQPSFMDRLPLILVSGCRDRGQILGTHQSSLQHAQRCTTHGLAVPPQPTVPVCSPTSDAQAHKALRCNIVTSNQ
jgi:hypothetical protein